MKRHCLECGSEIQGRTDKRFCSPDCRATQYNRENRLKTNFMRNVNNILRKNRRILEKYNPDGKAKVAKSKLLEDGFKFSYFTNTYETRAGKIYYFCYEQGYLPIDNDWYALVVRQEYVV
jgi:predicted nucleic acid-binding Zn ribbon protein